MSTQDIQPSPRTKASSPEGEGRLPDFLIVGAMKAGTTSLAYLLSQHEGIFIPPFEVFFFDIDDIEEHPDFLVEAPDGWSSYDYERNFDQYLSWYRSFFEDAEERQVIGDRSTTYMASKKAPHRIATLLPDVKLIFMLRDPVRRTYSHYWHLVRTGRAIYDFEESIRYVPRSILQRSFYKRQIMRYKEHFRDANLKFMIFESFIINVQDTVDEICHWLGLESSVDTARLETRKNPAILPRNLKLQIAHNRMFRKFAAERYISSHLPDMPRGKSNMFLRAMSYAFRKINLTTQQRYPPMNPGTKRFLQELFGKENRGLSELIGEDLQEYWPYMQD